MSSPVIFFDMDGTLIDTEKYYCPCWRQAAIDLGYPMTWEQALSMRSLGRPFHEEHFREMFGPDADYHKVRSHRIELMEPLLKKNGIEAKPGAAEALKILKEKGYTLAVTTASDLGRTEKYLSETGLLPYFDRLICASMVERGKPAPDIYLYACQVMGIKPSDSRTSEETLNTIAFPWSVEDSPNGVTSAWAVEDSPNGVTSAWAVEDSPNGVTSAWAAGCRVIMIPDQSEPDDELARKCFRVERSLIEMAEHMQNFLLRP